MFLTSPTPPCKLITSSIIALESVLDAVGIFYLKMASRLTEGYFAAPVDDRLMPLYHHPVR